MGDKEGIRVSRVGRELQDIRCKNGLLLSPGSSFLFIFCFVLFLLVSLYLPPLSLPPSLSVFRFNLPPHYALSLFLSSCLFLHSFSSLLIHYLRISLFVSHTFSIHVCLILSRPFCIPPDTFFTLSFLPSPPHTSSSSHPILSFPSLIPIPPTPPHPLSSSIPIPSLPLSLHPLPFPPSSPSPLSPSLSPLSPNLCTSPLPLSPPPPSL